MVDVKAPTHIALSITFLFVDFLNESSCKQNKQSKVVSDFAAEMVLKSDAARKVERNVAPCVRAALSTNSIK